MQGFTGIQKAYKVHGNLRYLTIVPFSAEGQELFINSSPRFLFRYLAGPELARPHCFLVDD